MYYILRTLVVAVLAILGIALSVTAQTDRSRGIELLRAELDRTDQMIERAEPLVRNSENQTAIGTLDRAKNLQGRAHEEFSKATLAGYASARKLTLLAREQVLLALKLIGGARGNTEQQDDFVLRKLESAASLLDRALESLATVETRSLVAIAEAAKGNLDRAWEFYRNKQYRPALKLAEQVEKAAEKILSTTERGEIGREDFDRRSSNVRQLIDQVRQQLTDCNTETGQAFLAEAEQAFRLAQELHDRQRIGASLQALQRARELAMKAGRECRGLERLQERYDQLTAQLNRLKDATSAPGYQAADSFRKLVAQAEDQLSLASRHINGGDWRKAAVALQAAQIAIRQAEELMKQAG